MSLELFININFDKVLQNMISSIVDSNRIRRDFVPNQVLNNVGYYAYNTDDQYKQEK